MSLFFVDAFGPVVSVCCAVVSNLLVFFRRPCRLTSFLPSSLRAASMDCVCRQDPNNLLKGNGNEGITVCLLERGHPGLRLGDRHDPSASRYLLHHAGCCSCLCRQRVLLFTSVHRPPVLVLMLPSRSAKASGGLDMSPTVCDSCVCMLCENPCRSTPPPSSLHRRRREAFYSHVNAGGVT